MFISFQIILNYFIFYLKQYFMDWLFGSKKKKKPKKKLKPFPKIDYSNSNKAFKLRLPVDRQSEFRRF